MSFETGWYDERGNLCPERILDWLGVEVVGLFPSITGENFICASRRIESFDQGRLAERPPMALMVETKSDVEILARYTEPIDRVYVAFREISKWPAVLRVRIGRGSVTYFTCPIEALLGQMTPTFLEKFYAAIVGELVGSPMIETDAPPTVMMEFYKKASGGTRLLHMVNCTGDMQRPIARRIEVGPISVAIATEKKPSAVRLPLRGKDSTFEFENGRVRCVIDKIDLYEILEIVL